MDINICFISHRSKILRKNPQESPIFNPPQSKRFEYFEIFNLWVGGAGTEYQNCHSRKLWKSPILYFQPTHSEQEVG